MVQLISGYSPQPRIDVFLRLDITKLTSLFVVLVLTAAPPAYPVLNVLPAQLIATKTPMAPVSLPVLPASSKTTKPGSVPAVHMTVSRVMPV